MSKSPIDLSNAYHIKPNSFPFTQGPVVCGKVAKVAWVKSILAFDTIAWCFGFHSSKTMWTNWKEIRGECHK